MNCPRRRTTILIRSLCQAAVSRTGPLWFRVHDLNSVSLDALYAELTRGDALAALVKLAYDEDLGQNGRPGDITSRACIPESSRGHAKLVARQPGVLAGVRCMPTILNRFAPNCSLGVGAADGQRIESGQQIATIEGPTREVLAAERTLLNLLSRLSGIATGTAEYVGRVSHTHARLLDTRKTTPGLRGLEKYAVRCGGGHCHRIGLFDAMLIKDNHLAGVPVDHLAQFVASAIAKGRAIAQESGGLRFVELEVDTLDQLEAVMSAGLCDPKSSPRSVIDIVLLDNMSCDELRAAVRMRAGAGASVLLEASGGVTLETIAEIAETGVDRISVGGLTHQARSLDLALDIG